MGHFAQGVIYANAFIFSFLVFIFLNIGLEKIGPLEFIRSGYVLNT